MIPDLPSRNAIINVCWDITSDCNDHCQFCYRNRASKGLSFEDNCKVLKNLINASVLKISFVGGEPLLYDRLLDLARVGHQYSSSVIYSFTTNGIILAPWNSQTGSFDINRILIAEIAENFSWIVFSLDAPTPELQSKMTRNIHHYDRIITLIEYIRKHHPNLNIKINTLVTRVNQNSIIELYRVLEHTGIKRWKLFRFLPSRGSAFENRKQFYITKPVFDRVCSEVVSIAGHQIKITINSYSDFENTYINISSDGYIIKYDGEKYIKVFDCKENLQGYIYLHPAFIKAHLQKRADFLSV